MKMQLNVMTVTPELAREWLALNRRNRDPKRAAIKRYLRSMRDGEWRAETPECLAFAGKFEVLLDGQNRLMALVEYGKPIRMSVATYVDEDCASYINTGVSRTMPDRIQIAVPGVEKRIAEVAMRFAIGGYCPRVDQAPHTPEDFGEMAKVHLDQLVETNALLSVTRKGVSQVGVRAAVARAMAEDTSAPRLRRIREFCSVMVSGVCQGTEDSAAIALRDHLLQIPATGSLGSFNVYQKAEGAVLAFLNRIPRSSATPAVTNREIFVLPEDEDWVPKDMLEKNREVVGRIRRRAKVA